MLSGRIFNTAYPNCKTYIANYFLLKRRPFTENRHRRLYSYSIFLSPLIRFVLFIMILTGVYHKNLLSNSIVIRCAKNKIVKPASPFFFSIQNSVKKHAVYLKECTIRRKSNLCKPSSLYQYHLKNHLLFTYNEASSRNVSTLNSRRSMKSVHGGILHPFSNSSYANITSFCFRSISTTAPSRKLNIVLDLDECLVHSQITEPEGLSYRQQEYRPEALKNADKLETFQLLLSDNALVKVHKRPFLDEFLRNISSRYENIYVFTAGTEGYAKPVFDTLDPEGKIFKGRFYRQHCTRAGVLYVKDLSIIHQELDMTKTILIDNNEISFIANPENGILVKSFYDDYQDKTLPAVYEFLSKELENEEDVRVKLKEMFQLRKHLMAYKHHVPLAYRQKWFLQDKSDNEKKE